MKNNIANYNNVAKILTIIQKMDTVGLHELDRISIQNDIHN